MQNLIAVGQMVRRSTGKLGSSRPAFQGHSRSLELTRIDRVPVTSYLRSVVTVALSCTVSEKYGHIYQKLRIFPPDPYLTPPKRGFPSEIDSTGRTQENGMMGLTDRDGCLAISVQYTNVTDRQTDRQNDTGRRIASSGNN